MIINIMEHECMESVGPLLDKVAWKNIADKRDKKRGNNGEIYNRRHYTVHK